jgi:1,4-dihydroxy-2-naphthoyl-CoA synthase
LIQKPKEDSQTEQGKYELLSHMEYSELVYRLNSVTELVNVLTKYKMIDAIQVIRWQGNNITDSGGYTVCYGSDDKKKKFSYWLPAT